MLTHWRYCSLALNHRYHATYKHKWIRTTKGTSQMDSDFQSMFVKYQEALVFLLGLSSHSGNALCHVVLGWCSMQATSPTFNNPSQMPLTRDLHLLTSWVTVTGSLDAVLDCYTVWACWHQWNMMPSIGWHHPFVTVGLNKYWDCLISVLVGSHDRWEFLPFCKGY